MIDTHSGQTTKTLRDWFKQGGQGKSNPTDLEIRHDYAFAEEIAKATIAAVLSDPAKIWDPDNPDFEAGIHAYEDECHKRVKEWFVQ